MARCLVTGVAGFIGSHLAEALLEAGWLVRGVDNLSTGQPENLELLHDVGRCNFEFIRGDIRSQVICERASKDVEVVYHLAALGSVPRSVIDPATTHDHNATGTLNMLHGAAKNGVKCFVYSSSSSVYGDTEELPKHEDMTPRPVSPYAVSKLAGEMYCQAFWRTYSFPTIALRYFNVYGPRQSPHGPYAAVIPRWAEAMLGGKETPLFGDGQQTRDFTYVKDVVAANLRAGRARVGTMDERSFGKAFNAGRGSPVSLRELHKLMADRLDYSAAPSLEPARTGDVRDSWAEIKRLFIHLEHEPQWGLEEGLDETLEWYRRKHG